MSNQQTIIFHHYPQSPVSEKVRLVFGIKSLDWQSVTIPRLPPKPDLMPLTGGYRRTPVMQIGADVYCDSLCIIRELERRFPQPSLFPYHSEGISYGLSRWTDGVLFTRAVAVVFGSNAATLDPEFALDRGRLYFGPDFNLDQLEKELAVNIALLAAELTWIEDQLTGNGPYLFGPDPGLVDLLCYHVIWFLRGRCKEGPGILARFPNLQAWEAAVTRLGHGNSTDLDATQALEIARNSSPANPGHPQASDPGQLNPGDSVTVVPDGDGGDPAVAGTLAALTAHTVTIARRSPRTGDLQVHFPLAGYRLTVAP